METKTYFVCAISIMKQNRKSLTLTGVFLIFSIAGSIPEGGVPDMTLLSVLDEAIINKNLKIRYDNDQIYVSFLFEERGAICDVFLTLWKL